MHERKLIRDAVVAAIKGTAPAFSTHARERVYHSRTAPIRGHELPCVNVYVGDETVDEVQGVPRELKRTLIVSVEAWVAHGETSEDELDTLALQIETAMDRDRFLGGAVSDCVLQSTTPGYVDGERRCGVMHLEYAAQYFTPERAPGATDDLKTVATELKPAEAW